MKCSLCAVARCGLAFSVLLGGSLCVAAAAGEWESPTRGTRPDITTNVLTLDAAIGVALENNPLVRASGARVGAAAGRAYQAKLWANPELEFAAEDWPVNGGGFSEAKQTVGMAQTLPFPGKKRLDGRIGVAGVRQSEAELKLQRVQVVRDVKLAFYQILAAEQVVKVAEELVTVAESSAATARKRVAAGAAPDQEQLRAEIPLEEAKAELTGFQQELAASRQTLALVLGRPDMQEVPVVGHLAESAAAGLLARRPGDWLAGHPSVVAAQTALDRAELEVRRARLEPYPDVKAAVSGGREAETGQGIIQLGLSLPLPIFDTGKGKREEAQANQLVADAELVSLEQRLLREWNVAGQRLRAAAAQVTSYRERILPKANDALRLVQTGFEQGKFGVVDLLDTQRTTAQARLAYQKKLLELNTAEAELEALEGKPPAETGPARPPAAEDKN